MAETDDLFKQFDDKITVSSNQKEALKRGREAIRTRISAYFRNELGLTKPDFYQQGSYALKTMVSPINPADEIDLDDGVYLMHLSDIQTEWPTAQTVSRWIVEAVKDHTKKPPINKMNCVRVVYADGFHVDLPIYSMSFGRPYLARLGDDQWVLNDPKAFNSWFYQKLAQSEQMRRCIRYLKAWKDFRGCLLKGIHITILVGHSFVETNNRDDQSLVYTLASIIQNLKAVRAIYNPVDTTEDLIRHWTDANINNTIVGLEALHEKTMAALADPDKESASRVWATIFGTRFPLYKTSKPLSIAATAPAITRKREPVKPWRAC